jgi:hypothetical protein
MSDQRETCDDCGDDARREDMVRKLRAYGYRPGQNLIPYSSYSSSFWTVDTSVDASDISFGVYADYFRPRPVEDNDLGGYTVTEERGSQSWTASGVYRSSTAVDISSWTNVCFSIHVGPYHAQTIQAVSVVLGFCSANGVTKYPQRTWSFNGGKKIWFSSAVDDLNAGITTSAAYLYAAVTISGASSIWWADLAVLDDQTQPLDYYHGKTAGSAQNLTDDGYTWQVGKFCPKCADEKIIKPSDNAKVLHRQAPWIVIPSEIEGL